ncbi:MAG TPA: NAD(P)-dependent oxidoreductase [Ktedonobacterales bacterium]|jgi:3-hydroxyisobutyrate dehydrogenase|nr:NAD(P)-dependent oxidoreductase [Ktedonobacterales bacterium]
MRAGFIGLGIMGKPMARNLLKAGFALTIYARRPETVGDLVAAGATLVGSAAAVGQAAEVIVTMLPNAPEVEEVVLGPRGVLAGAAAGAIVVDMSTIAPAASRRLAAACAARGVAFLDAPVSGGSVGAERGTLSIMVGGEAAAFATCRPLFEAMGRPETLFHVGPSGSGEVVKLANNLLCGVIAAASAEALALGVKNGVDAATVANIIGVSSGASWQLSNVFPLRVWDGSFTPGFMTDLLLKDLGLALDLAAEGGVPLRLTELARELYEQSRAAGHGRDDYTAVIQQIEDAAGIQVRAPRPQEP